MGIIKEGSMYVHVEDALSESMDRPRQLLRPVPKTAMPAIRSENSSNDRTILNAFCESVSMNYDRGK